MASLRPVAALLTLATLTLPAAARAQSEGDPEALLREGAALRREGRYDEAVERLRQAVEQHRTGRALAELGLAEKGLGRWLDAESHLAEALLLEEEAWIRHHRREVENALAEARASIGRLRVTTNVDGAEVRVNGALVGRTPLREPVRVDIGRAAVELRLRGYVTATRTVSVNAFGEAEANVPLDREGPPPDTAPPPPPRCAPGLELRDGLCFAPPEPEPEGFTPPRVMMVAGGAVAVVSAAVAIGLGVAGNGVESAYLARCGGRSVPQACEADRRATQEELDGRAAGVNAMWAVAVVGAAVAGAGALWEFRPWRRRPRRDAVTVTLSPFGARLVW